jgi:hypothetical protein
MGTPPAVVYAMLYYAIHELAMPISFKECLAIYKRYIDDGIGIWLSTDPTLWSKFKNWICSFGTLQWTFTEPSLQVDYLDITIRINPLGKIHRTLFEKPLNLYLYLPPHSAHLPGVLTGLIYGMIRRVYRLTSCPNDCFTYLKKFYGRLHERGYSPQTFVPLFEAGLANRNRPPGRRATAPHQRTTSSSTSHTIQPIPAHKTYSRAFGMCCFTPPRSTPLPNMSTPHLGTQCGVTCMIIAYHRPCNLANIICPRKLEQTTGPPVSAYLRRDSKGHFACI